MFDKSIEGEGAQKNEKQRIERSDQVLGSTKSIYFLVKYSSELDIEYHGSDNGSEKCKETNRRTDNIIQCDAIRWEQFEN